MLSTATKQSLLQVLVCPHCHVSLTITDNDCPNEHHYPVVKGLGLENDILDTFDGYSPQYHGIHNPEEVESWFRKAGLINIIPVLGILVFVVCAREHC